MFNLAKHELYRLFVSPLAWVILAVTQLLMAYLFLSSIDAFTALQGQLSAIPGAPGVTALVAVPSMSNAAIITLLVSPLVTMRAFADERRNESLPLLMSAPLSITQIVLGKFLGLFLFLSTIVVLSLLMATSLTLGSPLDGYLLSAALLGLGLLVASFTAIGVYLSSLTRQPSVAAISTFAVLFFLWIIDWAGNSSSEVSVLSWLSFMQHFQSIAQGQINTQDLAFFLMVIVGFLLLTVRTLDRERLAS
jgi:ABC-2 type transport system permease protein